MPKSVDPVERKSSFAEASWELIEEEGLAGATLRRVAARAGCTTGALTHYFPDRNSLLVHALRSAHDAAAARMERALLRETGAKDRLRAVLKVALPLDDISRREWRVWLAFWAASMSDAELETENAARYREWQALLDRLLKPFFASAPMRRSQVSELTALIDGLGVGIVRLGAGGKELRVLQKEALQSVERVLERLEN